MSLRAATPDDLCAIWDIYAHHVRTGTGTFALTPPSLEEMSQNFALILRLDLPYVVACAGDKIVGFSYAAPFRLREGYRYGVEDALYVHPDHLGLGIGTLLLSELIDRCRARGLYHMMALIGDRDNLASQKVHAALGFVETGVLPHAGHKFGRWCDVVIMCKQLKEVETPPQGDGWALKQE